MDLLPKITVDDEKPAENLNEESEMVVIEEDLNQIVDYDAPLDRIFMDKPTNGKKISVSNNKRRIKVDKVDIPLGLPPGFSGHNKKEFIPMEISQGIKKKKPITEKQRAHLDKIRKLALEKRRSNALKKKVKQSDNKQSEQVEEVEEVKQVEKVEEKEEVEMHEEEKKEKPKKIDLQKEKELKQKEKYLERMEARRKKIELRIIQEEEEEEARFQEQQREKAEEEYFNKFVKNMNKYNYLKTKTQTNNLEKTVNKKLPKILEAKENPFKDIFEW